MVYETDAIVVAPHAVFVIEIKAYRGTIEGTDYPPARRHFCTVTARL